MTHQKIILITSIIFVLFSFVLSFLCGENTTNTIINIVLAVDAILISIVIIINLRSIDLKLNALPRKNLNYVGNESAEEIIGKLLNLVEQLTIVTEHSAKIFKATPLFVILAFAGFMSLSQMIFG